MVMDKIYRTKGLKRGSTILLHTLYVTVLSVFSVILFCFVQAKLYVGCIYVLTALVRVYVDVMVMSSA